MARQWKPRLVSTGAAPPAGWTWPVSGEIRLALLLGVLLGLGFAFASDSGPPVPASGPLSIVESGSVTVIDGDTFRYQGDKIRIADIDTPETHSPRCRDEAELGARATSRLSELLAAGDFVLNPVDRDEDRYGRKLRIVTRNGKSVGDALIAEGLARPYAGGRRSWCS